MFAESLNITPAKHGGFIVLGSSDYGADRSPLFAGTLVECLEFMRAKLAARVPAEA
jgi:hypothetical protein